MNEAYTRRDVLGQGLGLLGAWMMLPHFLRYEGKSAKDERILVVLQLQGGNDGLNTVIPFRQDPYYRLRSQIAIAQDQVLKLNDDLGLHPQAIGLKKLFDEGQLAVALGVGYPNPNRSHFVSTDIWSSADPEERTYNGWLGRYLDTCCAKKHDPELGIAVTSEMPFAMEGERFRPICFESPEELQWRTRRGGRAAEQAFQKLQKGSGPTSGDGALDFVRRASQDAQESAEKIRKAASDAEQPGRGRVRERSKVPLEQQLAMVSEMIRAGLPTRVYYVTLGGFDTHSGEQGRHQALMKQLGDSLASFAKNLKENKIEDRVLLLTFSEFGRRVAQNASGGTDHGTAAPLFIMGAGVKGGLYGSQPSLEQLDGNGDLQFSTDFRSVYASALDGWLQTDSQKILGGKFAPLPLLRKS